MKSKKRKQQNNIPVIYENVYHVELLDDSGILSAYDTIPVMEALPPQKFTKEAEEEEDLYRDLHGNDNFILNILQSSKKQQEEEESGRKYKDLVILDTWIIKGHVIRLKGLDYIELYSIIIGRILNREESTIYFHCVNAAGSSENVLDSLLYDKSTTNHRKSYDFWPEGPTEDPSTYWLRLIYRIPLPKYNPWDGFVPPKDTVLVSFLHTTTKKITVPNRSPKNDTIIGSKLISVPQWLWNYGITTKFGIDNYIFE